MTTTLTLTPALALASKYANLADTVDDRTLDPSRFGRSGCLIDRLKALSLTLEFAHSTSLARDFGECLAYASCSPSAVGIREMLIADIWPLLTDEQQQEQRERFQHAQYANLFQASPYSIGWKDGHEAAFGSGTADEPVDGWDGSLINAIGYTDACKLLGIDADQDSNRPGWTDSAKAILSAYRRGAQAGADAAVE